VLLIIVKVVLLNIGGLVLKINVTKLTVVLQSHTLIRDFGSTK
jgi:hypothetical protein